MAIGHRAHELLTEQAGFDPDDVILDPNIFAIGTGIEEHAGYAVAYFEAVRRIKPELPGVLVSGGVSNVSFSFRGNDPVREAIHSVFLYHAIRAGMDMGIVNAGALPVYDDIPAELRERVEDLVLNRRDDATERMLEIADEVRGGERGSAGGRDLAWREAPVNERLRTRSSRASPTTSSRTPRRRAHRRAAPRGHRGPADGRHGRGRRPVRQRPDVPAAGGQERPGDEAGRRPPRAVHRGREGQARPWRCRTATATAARQKAVRHGRHGHGQGRRPRHRQEHRRRRPRLQRLRRHRPRRDGAVAEDPRDGARGEGRPHRPVRADHAVARGDAHRRPGDGARGHDAAAAHRRRDHVARPHRGALEPAYSRPGRARPGRVARGGRRPAPCSTTSARDEFVARRASTRSCAASTPSATTATAPDARARHAPTG